MGVSHLFFGVVMCVICVQASDAYDGATYSFSKKRGLTLK